MEIVVEYALLDNFLIDMIILFVSCKLKREKISVARLCISSLFGAICALLMPLLNCANFLIIGVKLLIGVVMVLIAHKCSTFKKFILDYFIFLSTTAVFGGVGIGVLYLFFGSVTLTSGFAINSPISMSAIYIALFAWAYGVVASIKFFYRKKNRNEFTFEIELECKDKKVESMAYLDSGNTLVDPVTQKPVVIIGLKTFNKLHKDVALENLLMKKLDKIKIDGAHYIEYQTLNNQKMSMLITPIDKIEMKNKKEKSGLKDCVLGLSFAKFQKSFGCDILLNQNCF